MPTLDPQQALTLEAAQDQVLRQAFGSADGQPHPVGGLRVGLEPERFVWRAADPNHPTRLPLLGPGGVVESIAALSAREPDLLARAADKPLAQFNLSGGGTLTFEPGGQVEHSTKVHANLAAALDDCNRVDALLARAFAGSDLQQGFLGLDPWHTAALVPQQLEAPRYRAMARYFDLRGPSGAAMMRLSASLQVNLDLESGAAGEERALLGYLLSPALTAIFSSSPNLPGQPKRHSRRARVWQTIDPTRSGFPRKLLSDSRCSVAEAYVDGALCADVLLLLDSSGDALPGTPGQSFADWIRQPHPRLGYPTASDLTYHLSTLFFEVRCRGFLELRPIDALPDRERSAAAALVCGLMLDPRARSQALDRLQAWRPQLAQLWWRAADLGLEESELQQAALDLFELAGQGLTRLGEGFLGREQRKHFEAFYDCFTAQGRAPADLLREALVNDPAAALRYASRGALCPGSGTPSDAWQPAQQC